MAEHDGDLLHWFYDQGLVPGQEIELRSAEPAADQFTVALDGGERAISEKAAAGLFVRPAVLPKIGVKRSCRYRVDVEWKGMAWMASSKRQTTMAKTVREQAVRERRERTEAGEERRAQAGRPRADRKPGRGRRARGSDRAH